MMKCSVILIVAVFSIAISVTGATVEQKGSTVQTKSRNLKKPDTQDAKTVDGKNTLAPGQSKNENPKGGYSTGLYDDTKLELLKNKAATVNPMNLISAVMMEGKDKLTRAVQPLKWMRDRILGKSPLGTFIDNLIILIANIHSDTLNSMVHLFPNFFNTLKKVGKDLRSVAKSQKDKLAIFDDKLFEAIIDPHFNDFENDSAIPESQEPSVADSTNEDSLEDENPSDESQIPQYTLQDSVTGTPFVITMSRREVKSKNSD